LCILKKLVLIIIAVFLLSGKAFANFNYSYDTYSTDSGSLILNSLGDQVTNSHYGALGSNDFISENAYKNSLALDGYTVAYDYNPQNTNPQFSADYNTPLPNGGAGLTELQFAGFEGNPRAIQDVYVLTSEYDALSAQGQANSISNLDTTVNNQGAQITTNTSNISNLYGITNVQEQQITQVGGVATTAYNNTQIEESQIQATNQQVAGQQHQINNLDSRVHKLEGAQGTVGGVLRLYDTRKWQVNAFIDYDTTTANVGEVGLRVTYKLGKSYEETRIDELNKKLDALLGKKQEDDAQSHIKYYSVSNGVGIKSDVNF
jgi:hypothetical protein